MTQNKNMQVQPTKEVMKKAAHISLVGRAVPIHAKAELDRGKVQCRMALPGPRTRRILVLSGVMLKLGFDIVAPGHLNVLHYRSGDWETKLDEPYQRAVQLVGEPPEPWLEIFSKPDKSITGSFGRRLLNFFLWPFGLHVATTRRELRLSRRLTSWQLAFRIFSLIGVAASFVYFRFGNAPAAVALGLIASFVSAFASSAKAHRSYQSRKYIEALKSMRDITQRLAHLLARHNEDDFLSNVQEVQVVSTSAWHELCSSRKTVEIEEKFTRRYARVLFWAKTWAVMCLVSPAERSRILFEEIILHPVRHCYLQGILGDPSGPAIKPLNEPDTWKEPLIREAGLLSEEVDRTL